MNNAVTLKLSTFLQSNFRCVLNEKCSVNDLTLKSGSDLIAAAADLATCPSQKGNDPRAAGKPGRCCSELDIIRDCSDPEFKNEGFKCLDKCFDKLDGMEKTGIRINGIFISSDKAKCPSENQVCCRKDKPPKTEFVGDNVICEENEGKVWHFYQKAFNK